VTDIALRFWGVRGSIPSPGSRTARYGGNTACVEVRCGDHLVIFDAGTGLRLLGNELVQAAAGVNTDIFLSHCHIDHIAGLPFFAPFFLPASQIRVWAGNLLPERALAQVARTVMSEPLFPSAAGIFRANIKFRDFHAGAVLEPRPGVTVRTASLNHPGRATGYRLEYRGCSIAYITDTEHRPGELDPHHRGLDSADGEERQRVADVEEPDPLVVDRPEPALERVGERTPHGRRRGTGQREGIAARHAVLLDLSAGSPCRRSRRPARGRSFPSRA